MSYGSVTPTPGMRAKYARRALIVVRHRIMLRMEQEGAKGQRIADEINAQEKPALPGTRSG